mmetsp:Transcript_51657/g.138731  ORF Transcript_51657/g.138731 Transcript_51657/m.138731 type:complete len:318 (+) Transcript_51657:852-1805(+)
MECHPTDPISVTFSRKHQLAPRHRPHLPCVVVAGRGNHRQLGMKRDARDRTQMAFECLGLLEIGHPCGFEGRVHVRVDTVLAGPGRLLGSLRGLLRRLLPTVQCLILGVRLHLRELLLQCLHLGQESVALQPHEHLLLHRHLVLVLELRERGLVLLVVLLEAAQVNDELVLLLHDASVVHAVEVALFPELVPRLFRGRRHLPGLIDLGAQHHHLLVQAVVASVDVRDNLEFGVFELATLLELVPFRLECLQAPLHAILDQEVPEEIVNHLRPLLDLRGPVAARGAARGSFVRGLGLGEEAVDVVEGLLLVLLEWLVR